ncbi:Na+/H+ antiporter NhaC [Limibacter armeniacum]|uniref:Na+/H+ antiporter NhaC n=1 Tax=Limibacter armeniacum TaxID=466084 RepID=UPI002FE5A68A
MNTNFRKPTLIEALVPIIFLIVTLAINVAFVFKDDGLSGSNQVVMMLATAIAGIMAYRLGMKWDTILQGIVDSISSAMSAILILLMIGALAGTWLLSGIVPAMIYYGLQVLNPSIFLVAACIICSIVSIATGSSWSTVATVGIALIGIGTALGIDKGIVAGAIISGAYFGDKMSPLSDTTNLAPAMAGTDLFTHIRYMMYTTIPSLILSLLIFLGIGFTYHTGGEQADISGVLNLLENTFNITPWLFLVPVIVVVLIVKKMPALPALLIGSLLGGVAALVFQPDIVKTIAGTEDFAMASYTAIMKAMYGSISITTENEMVNELLSTSGMFGMLGTIWLILMAMAFGGVMEVSGMLHTITEAIIRRVSSTGGLVTSTALTCGFFNLTASDQYLAIVVPGKMYAEAYQDQGLAPENLSRTLEDSATVTSVLIPWNTCGAAQSAALNVATMAYMPFCFFNIISPIMTILFGVLGIKIRKLSEVKSKATDEVMAN